MRDDSLTLRHNVRRAICDARLSSADKVHDIVVYGVRAHNEH